jgi:hypothetical protein
MEYFAVLRMSGKNFLQWTIFGYIGKV